jgi:hypothetical protein
MLTVYVVSPDERSVQENINAIGILLAEYASDHPEVPIYQARIRILLSQLSQIRNERVSGPETEAHTEDPALARRIAHLHHACPRIWDGNILVIHMTRFELNANMQ